MLKRDPITVSHFGICVSDLERSLQFYRDGLGFAAGGSVELVNQCGNVMSLDNFTLVTQYLTLGTVTIELLWFRHSIDSHRAEHLRPMNHTGLTHLALAVQDIDAVAQAIVSHGGKVYPATKGSLATAEGMVELLYCSDPDNTRIELIHFPD